MKVGRKITGGRYVKSRKKKLYERKKQERTIKIGAEKKKIQMIRGGKRKTHLLTAKFVNVLMKAKDKKLPLNKRIEIKNVVETPSNRFLARQNIITKGTIVETELGKVRITNRPSQEGMVNGILIG
ncbi:MAG TPA: 30S ribosomal protein S8e [Candidatus Nanoarchaeia archaeon]|nr:30S ribosomal protein S8e [Candidatus Nanoarchaeia archaeon]